MRLDTGHLDRSVAALESAFALLQEQEPGSVASAVSSVATGWAAGRLGAQRARSAFAALIPYFTPDYVTLALGLAALSLFAGCRRVRARAARRRGPAGERARLARGLAATFGPCAVDGGSA